jgi:hypothetical protein
MAKGGRRSHSGRKPKPTAMKVVQGTFRADRHGGERTVAPGWPVAPNHLTPREAVLWAGLEPHCATWVAPSDWPAVNGVVSLLDRVLRNQEAQRETDTAGHPLAFKHVVMTPNEEQTQKGIVAVEVVEAKENPLITQEVKLWRELRAYLGLVGLSPVDRARVSAHEPDAPDNPLEKFLHRSKR